ncbi:MAG: hypothetical protein ABWZ52_02875, partial [Acidimicrobiales bacterium]
RDRLGLGRLSARGTFVIAMVAGEAILLVLTESLSLGHHLTSGHLTIAWLLVTIAAAGGVIRSNGIGLARAWVRGGGLERTAGAITGRPVVLVGLIGLVLIGAVLVLTAWWYPPNNADSLAYHLVRVEHWIQERSIAHYASHYLAQLEYTPLHEFNMLHLHLLAASDRLDGFVQLAAFVVCVVGAAEIARFLGGRAEVQLLTAVIAASTPSLVLEATSTQNNLFPAALALGAVLIVLAWEPLRSPVLPGIVLGLGVGLMALGKGSAIPLVAPIIVAFGLRIAVTEARTVPFATAARRLLLVAGVAGVAALLVVGPFEKRNHDLLGSFTGHDTERTLNDEVTLRWAVANSIRNVALHFRIGDGSGGFDTETSELALRAMGSLYDATGAPRNSGHADYGFGHDPFELRDYSDYERNEDYGASPWLVLLLIVTAPSLLLRARRGGAPAVSAAIALVAGVVGFLAFSATTRWTPYGARYVMPLLVLAPPLVAVALAAVHRNLLRFVAAALVLAGLPSLLDSWARPVLDRREATNELDAYFAPRPVGDAPFPAPIDYLAVRDAVVASGCGQLGVGSWVIFEYPLWAGLDNAGWDGKIQHVGVENESRALEDRDFEPCAIVWDSIWGGPVRPVDGMVQLEYGDLTLLLDESLADQPGIPPATPAS